MVDDDLDTYSECTGDCNDADSTVYPGAAELCDGLSNDCLNPDWPTPLSDDVDNDSDALSECEGD